MDGFRKALANGQAVEDDDDVSREVMASAFAIEEMSARVKQISDQVERTVVEAEQADAEGTLPAFVIGHANPVLEEIANQMTREGGSWRMRN
jgi:hypothetical protein